MERLWRVVKISKYHFVIKKLLIIGYGSIGKKHASLIKENFKNIEIYILTSQRVQEFQTIANINLITNLGFKYIIICSETSKHLKQILFIEKKLKGVKILVEKPILHKFKKIILKNNSYYVGYNLRYHPFLKLLKNYIKNKKIYKIMVNCNTYLPSWRKTDYKKSYSADPKKGGGVLLDLSHEIDYLIWIFGKITIYKSLITKKSDLKIDSEHSAMILGQVRSADLMINLDYFSLISRREIIIDLKQYTIKFDLISNVMTKTDKKKSKKSKLYAYSLENSYLEELGDFFKISPKYLCTYKEALETIKLIEKVRAMQ